MADGRLGYNIGMGTLPKIHVKDDVYSHFETFTKGIRDRTLYEIDPDSFEVVGVRKGNITESQHQCLSIAVSGGRALGAWSIFRLAFEMGRSTDADLRAENAILRAAIVAIKERPSTEPGIEFFYGQNPPECLAGCDTIYGKHSGDCPLKAAMDLIA